MLNNKQKAVMREIIQEELKKWEPDKDVRDYTYAIATCVIRALEESDEVELG